MKKVFFIIFIFLLLIMYLRCQSQDCDNNSSACSNYFKLQSSYIPTNHPYIDIIKIPINIVILGKTDADGYWGAYTPQEFQDDIYKFYWLNFSYQNTEPPSDPVPGYSSSYWLNSTNNTKITFELNEVYFYDNATWFDELYPTGFNHLVNYHFNLHHEALDVINCFILRHHNTNGDGGGVAEQITFNGHNVLIVRSYGYNDPNTPEPWVGNGGGFCYWTGINFNC